MNGREIYAKNDFATIAVETIVEDRIAVDLISFKDRYRASRTAVVFKVPGDSGLTVVSVIKFDRLSAYCKQRPHVSIIVANV